MHPPPLHLKVHGATIASLTPAKPNTRNHRLVGMERVIGIAGSPVGTWLSWVRPKVPNAQDVILLSTASQGFLPLPAPLRA